MLATLVSPFVWWFSISFVPSLAHLYTIFVASEGQEQQVSLWSSISDEIIDWKATGGSPRMLPSIDLYAQVDASSDREKRARSGERAGESFKCF